ncbi:uncharacterized protein MONBRDRAFT_32398 [Monosiga brevicollis MX1]|uniref:ornithine decarboxylase n=1 Tax=Monosiga brevicollis TaxID=81824 RepID=A9UZA0_MONBE|nr:uncharacterized protein MONBRDRAFT_32398 [Monosiga brevicollis MX1]EDQ89331.1 predicted protein [Monosiga brevicollis MX1]|eukprot:XP_001745907.1 hypothetical protein [Monosiga brevicollis MX1]
MVDVEAPIGLIQADLPEDYLGFEDKPENDEETPTLAAIPLKGNRHDHLRSTLKHVIKAGVMKEEHAFFLVDLGSVYRQHHLFKQELPDVTPFYAVKCNPDPMILRCLASLGANFDCASRAEIEAVLGIGVTPERIIYANPCKPASHIRYAKEVGVTLMTFDSAEELRKIAGIYPEASVVLRILADDSKSACRLGLKFGAVVGKQTTSLIEACKATGLNLAGVSFHVGSGCTDAAVYDDAIAKARQVFRDAEAYGFAPTVLDVGGGFPGEAVAGRTPKVRFESIANSIRDAVANHFSDVSGLRLIAEPGRYYAANAMTLALSVIAKRVVAPETSGDISPSETTFQGMLDADELETIPAGAMVNYFVNDGVYGSFNCIIFDHADVELQPLNYKKATGKKYNSTVWGPTCDSIDCVAKSCQLPDLDVGEWLYVAGMGAYTGAAASTFNGFAKADFIYAFSAYVPDQSGDSAEFQPPALPDDFPLEVLNLPWQYEADSN